MILQMDDDKCLVDGHSGSPVLGIDGKIIGMLMGSNRETSIEEVDDADEPFCAAFAVPARRIRQALAFDNWLGTETACGLKGHEDYCRDHGPCGVGEGNCDGTSECQAGLECVEDVGASYGFDADVAVCQPSSGDDNDNTPETATPIGINETATGELENEGDRDFFKITLSEAGVLTVFTEGPTDTYGELTSEGGGLTRPNDDGVDGHNFRLSVGLIAGTYFLKVWSLDPSTTGPYTLQATFEAATPVESTSTTVGQLESWGDHDLFRIILSEAGRLTVFTEGTINTYGSLIRQEDGRAVYNNDGGDDDNFRISQDVAAGIYFIEVWSFDPSTTGPYTLQATFERSASVAALVGYVDALASLHGLPTSIFGWALNERDPTASVFVEIYVDGPFGTSSEVYTVSPDHRRQDVNDDREVDGDHGFRWPLPERYRTERHTFYVYAVDRESNPTARTQLRSSPVSGPLGGRNYCREHGPCDIGEGDCDSDSECQAGLVCVEDVGASYGFASSMEVCETPVVGQCGSRRNTCTAGTADDEAVPDTATEYRWRCEDGADSGICTALKPVNGGLRHQP